MVSGFFRKKLKSVSSLGEGLKKARLKAALSLEDLASLTKIPKSYLISLEEGQYDLLPADVYVKGYLKAYSEYVGLDYHKILKLYKKERGIEEQVKKLKIIKTKKAKINLVITPRLIKIGSIILLVLGLFFYLWIQWQNIAAPPKLEILEPVSDFATKEALLVIRGKTEPEVELFINDQLIFIDAQGNFEKNIRLNPGMNTLSIKAKNKVGKETVITRKIFVELEKQKVVEKQNEAKCVEGLELTVKIKEEPTWLHILEDNKIAFSEIAPVNFVHTFRAKEKIILSSGKAYTTFVEFCGKELGILGQKGEIIKNKEFTKANL